MLKNFTSPSTRKITGHKLYYDFKLAQLRNGHNMIDVLCVVMS